MDISVENMTPEQVKQRLQNDVAFAFSFAVDNQPDLLIAELIESGARNVSDEESAYNALVYLSKTDVGKLKAVLDAVPYDSSINNYTGNQSPPPTTELQTRSFDFGSLLTIVGAVLPAVGALIGDTGGSLTEAERYELEQEKLRQEEERKRKNMQALIIGGIVFMGIIVLVIFLSKKKK